MRSKMEKIKIKVVNGLTGEAVAFEELCDGKWFWSDGGGTGAWEGTFPPQCPDFPCTRLFFTGTHRADGAEIYEGDEISPGNVATLNPRPHWFSVNFDRPLYAFKSIV